MYIHILQRMYQFILLICFPDFCARLYIMIKICFIYFQVAYINHHTISTTMKSKKKKKHGVQIGSNQKQKGLIKHAKRGVNRHQSTVIE